MSSQLIWGPSNMLVYGLRRHLTGHITFRRALVPARSYKGALRLALRPTRNKRRVLGSSENVVYN